MSIDDGVRQSRDLTRRHWPIIAGSCPDERIAGSILQSVEGIQTERAMDLDRKAHIDHWAITRGRPWTPINTRVQAPRFASFQTVTIRSTEIRHLRAFHSGAVDIGAILQVQIYGDDEALHYVVIAALEPIAQYFAETERPYLRTAPDGQTFCPLTCSDLLHIGAFVWDADFEGDRLFQQLGLDL